MLEEHVVPFVKKLKELRYSGGLIETSRFAAKEFVVYLEGRVRSPGEISAKHIDGYVGVRCRLLAHAQSRAISAAYRQQLVGAVRRFMIYLRTQGVRTGVPIPEKQDLRLVPGYEDQLREFEQFLFRHRGLAHRTVLKYLNDASLLCQALSGSGVPPWDDLTPERLYDHLRQESRRHGHLNLERTQTALRTFFRFLRLTGRCRKDLAAYLVRSRSFSLKSLPKTALPEDIYRIFNSMKGRKPGDIRDRAIFLLLTLYGLRIGEVVRLRLDDIQWQAKKLVVRPRKAGRDLALPLHPAVAHALSEHIELVRPTLAVRREIFLARGSQRYVMGSSLSRTLSYRIKKLGLKLSPHTLHTTAVHLLQAGVEINVIKAWLGHADVSTTSQYLDLDLDKKREALELFLKLDIDRMVDGAKNQAPLPAGIVSWLERL